MPSINTTRHPATNFALAPCSERASIPMALRKRCKVSLKRCSLPLGMVLLRCVLEVEYGGLDCFFPFIGISRPFDQEFPEFRAISCHLAVCLTAVNHLPPDDNRVCDRDLCSAFWCHGGNLLGCGRRGFAGTDRADARHGGEKEYQRPGQTVRKGSLRGNVGILVGLHDNQMLGESEPRGVVEAMPPPWRSGRDSNPRPPA